jgi:hypothetical protein
LVSFQLTGSITLMVASSELRMKIGGAVWACAGNAASMAAVNRGAKNFTNAHFQVAREFSRQPPDFTPP